MSASAMYGRTEGEWQELEQAGWDFLITDLTTVMSPPDSHDAWLAAVDLAAERQSPLWSDDVAVRSIAADRGAATFGTWALLAALAEMALAPDTSREDAQVLSREGVVEFAADE